MNYFAVLRKFGSMIYFEGLRLRAHDICLYSFLFGLAFRDQLAMRQGLQRSTLFWTRRSIVCVNVRRDVFVPAYCRCEVIRGVGVSEELLTLPRARKQHARPDNACRLGGAFRSASRDPMVCLEAGCGEPTNVDTAAILQARRRMPWTFQLRPDVQQPLSDTHGQL